MSNTAILEVNGQKHEFPLVEGTENEIAIDIKALRNVTNGVTTICLLYTSPSPRDRQKSRMPSSA